MWIRETEMETEAERVAMRRRGDRQELKRVHCTQLLLSIVVLVLIREAAAVPNLRGVAPQDEKYYQTAIIRCKDGSKTFVQERLNDDFCDCVDGTDEPGTNACPEAKYYCKNLGHSPVLLFSSRVNDGICDCCDGSDEFDGKIRCPNTCRESGKQSNEKLKKKLATFKEGSTIRQQDVTNAQKLRQEHEVELLQLKGEEKTLKDVVSKLKVEKEAVEKAEKQEKEEKVRREKEDQERREKEKAAAIEKPQQAEETPSQVEVPPESPMEVDTETEQDEAEHAETEVLDHMSEADRGRVVASRWTGEDVSDILSSQEDESDHHSADDEDDASDEEAALAHEHDEDDDYEVPDFSLSETLTPSSPESSVGEHSSWWSRLLIKPTSLLELFRINGPAVDTSEADRIRKEYQEWSAKLKGIESKISELETRTKQDFGKEGEFYAFYDNCFELKDRKYVYKVCPYKDATQVEGHSTTRLGRWQGFKEGHKEMIFQSGDKCWNGPERSLRVKMRCGTKLELRSVDEPSRCEYVAEFSTPALCLQSKVQALEQQLSQKDPDFVFSHDEL